MMRLYAALIGTLALHARLAFPIFAGRGSGHCISARSQSRKFEHCLVTKLSSWRTPIETGTSDRKELAFASEAAGMIFHYTLTATPDGTRVEARRKNNIAPGKQLGSATCQTNDLHLF